MKACYWPGAVLVIFLFCISFVTILVNSNEYAGLSELEHYALYKREFIRQGVLKENHEKLNVVVVGASGLACGFVPKTFDELSLRTNTWNLSLASHMGLKHKYMLTDFITYNYVPDVIIWNPGEYSERHFTLGGGFYESVHLFLETGEPFFLINGIVPGLDKGRVVDVIDTWFTDEVEVSGAKPEQMLDDKGTYYWGWPGRPGIYKTLSKESGWVAPDWRPDEFRPVVNPSSEFMRHIYQFLDVARKHNIKVLVVPFPSGKGTYRPYEEIPAYYLYMQEYYDGVTVIPSWNKLSFDGPYMADSGHLNFEGAKLYTSYVLDEFRKLYL